tara:strand:+ start:211 stop:549 length:339 start_codon:yes stop_codon:yes gene_type:complete
LGALFLRRIAVAYRRLPAAPNLENLKNQAKSLLAAYRNGEAQAVADFAEFHPRAVSSAAHLTDAQLVLARSYQQSSWQSLASTAQVRRALQDVRWPHIKLRAHSKASARLQA